MLAYIVEAIDPRAVLVCGVCVDLSLSSENSNKSSISAIGLCSL